jgi:hypothetical protein
MVTLKMCGAPGLVECRARRCAGGLHFRGLGVLIGISRLRLELPTLRRRSRDPSHTLGAAPTSCRSYALDNNSTVTLYKRASLFPAVVERLPMSSACSLHARPLQPGGTGQFVPQLVFCSWAAQNDISVPAQPAGNPAQIHIAKLPSQPG